MEKSVKDAIDRAAGSQIAAQELSKDVKELEVILKDVSASKQKAEKELAVRDAALNARIDHMIQRLATATPAKKRTLCAHVKVAAGLCSISLLLSLVAFLGLRTDSGVYVVEGAYATISVAMAVSAILWSFFSRLYHGSWYNFEEVMLKFVRNVPTDDLKDLRPDSNSLQELKHKDPRLIEVSVYSVEKDASVVLVVSAELLAQLTAPRYMTLGLRESQVWDRLVRGAETNQTVNQDRYRSMIGQNVSMNTALVALYLWRQYCAEIDEAGFLFPRAQ